MANIFKSSKNKHFAVSLVSMIILLFLIIVFDDTEKTNTAVKLNEDNVPEYTVPEPEFSVEGGFYENEFNLTLKSSPDTKIYYTLDCTEPTEKSFEYKGAIPIKNITNTENRYSMLTNTSCGFYEDLIEQHGANTPSYSYKAPDYPIDKCMVIRAVAMDKHGNFSTVKTNTYFVGVTPETYDNCNIISVVVHPDDLFDSKKGIYVTGDIFDDYLKEGNINSLWCNWKANYHQRGKDWERRADFTLFNANGNIILSSVGGIRIQGGTSRALLPKSLNLFTDKKYGNNSVMNSDIFDDKYIPSKITLCSGGNEVKTQFNDYMVSDRIKDYLDVVKMSYKPYVLFLDGEYWGFYWMATSYNDRFISSHYNVNEDSILMIKNGLLEIGDDDGLSSIYNQMLGFISNNDMSNSYNYEKACKMIDINSYIDYYACLIYIARNSDWPCNNYALWCTIRQNDGEFLDEKWRWIIFDCNSSSMTKNLVEHNTLNYVCECNKMFDSLWKNADFRASFEKRIFEIADMCFDAVEMSDYIDKYAKKMYPIMSKSWKRFYGSENNIETAFYKTLESHREFFNNRRAVVESWFSDK